MAGSLLVLCLLGWSRTKCGTLVKRKHRCQDISFKCGVIAVHQAPTLVRPFLQPFLKVARPVTVGELSLCAMAAWRMRVKSAFRSPSLFLLFTQSFCEAQLLRPKGSTVCTYSRLSSQTKTCAPGRPRNLLNFGRDTSILATVQYLSTTVRVHVSTVPKSTASRNGCQFFANRHFGQSEHRRIQ